MQITVNRLIPAMLCIIFFLYAGNTNSQNIRSSSLEPRFVRDEIFIDGYLDEKIWSEAANHHDFTQYFPFDTSRAIARSNVKVLFNDEFIYIGANLEDSLDGEYVSLSLRRDFTTNNLDVFNIVLDPFGDQTVGYLFGVNPFNVQREGFISNGGNTGEDLDYSWDNIWYSEVSTSEDGWTVEIAIPFNTLRYREEAKSWGLNFFRSDSKLNEQSTWNRVPRQFLSYNLAFTGLLNWPSRLDAQQNNLSLIPYVLGGQSKDLLEGRSNNNYATGGDAKIGLSSSLNLDLTINPDFSQVEVDQQQTNLDRFELFFPERRQFFLENADLFSNFGFSDSRPFFSRRIGVAIDSATGQNVQNNLIAGARLTGKLGSDWRVGYLNIQGASDQSIGLPSFNYSVFSLQKKVFERSNVNLLYVGKHNFGAYDGGSGTEQNSNLVGVDYNLASADGKWTGKFYYHQTANPDTNTNDFSHGATINYTKLRFFASWTHQIIGKHFEAPVGFVPRNDFKRVNPVIGINIFPKSKWINQHRLSLSNNWIWKEGWGITDYNFAANWNVTFLNQANFTFSMLSNYLKLFFPFNPTGISGELFEPGEDFVQTGFLTSYRSDPRKAFFYNIQIITGGFYNGSLRQLSGTLNYRYKQYASIGFNYTLSRIILEGDFTDSDVILLGPRMDITFTNNLFWTTFIQYNSQFDNININSRVQWRFKPVSDLFLVYTDNYFPETFNAKNRSLVLKLTYWLNI